MMNGSKRKTQSNSGKGFVAVALAGLLAGAGLSATFSQSMANTLNTIAKKTGYKLSKNKRSECCKCPCVACS